jgi:alkanesulfonate monooxygenase SsuD/methylene tetrahydromethanopterin reductase-like flavin-dependent oxidoreductase (luciferase family)
VVNPRRPLKVGLHVPHQTIIMDGVTPRWADTLAFAQRAEQAGFDSLWLVDHLLSPRGAPVWRGGPPTSPDAEQRGCWECGSYLAALAVSVPRVELGTVVMCAGYRNPALIAKIAETVDEISGGRVILGVGAGDAEFEHRAFGYPYDHRVSRFEEAITIITGLLRGKVTTFEGQYHRIQDAALRPRGPRPQGLPIMIGALGTGPRMLRLVAQYADMWNGWLVHSRSYADAVPPLRDLVDQACETAGRDPATLQRSVAIRVSPLRQPAPTGEAIIGEPEAIADALRAHAAAGINHVQVWLTPLSLAGVEAFAPVLDLLDKG